MPYYNLQVLPQNRVLSGVADDRDAALDQFGSELNEVLTFADQGTAPSHLFGETEKNPHWVKCTIPVFKK